MSILTAAVGDTGGSTQVSPVAPYGGMSPRQPRPTASQAHPAALPTEGIGDRVRRFRRRLRMPPDQHVMTQPELGDLIGTDKGYIARIELGQVAQPGRDVLARLAKALKVKMRDLDPFYYEDEKAEDPLPLPDAIRREPTLDDDAKILLEQMYTALVRGRKD